MDATNSPSLEDYVEFLTALSDEGVPFTVIGGAAVGAYARLLNETVLSADLDILLEVDQLDELMSLAPKLGAKLEERPRERSVPVAFLRWRGLEVNALTASAGFPLTSSVIHTSREFEISNDGKFVPIADPLNLLANKLAVRRPKDLPHIEILRRFIKEECVEQLSRAELPPRRRLAATKRYLDVEEWKSIPTDLFRRLAKVALDAPSRRFLVSHAPTRRDAEGVRDDAPSNEREELGLLLARWEFP